MRTADIKRARFIPAGTILIDADAGFTKTVNVLLSLSCNDPTGCSEMKFSNDDVTYTNSETYAPSKAWTLAGPDGTKTVYVKLKDGLGNWSAPYSDSIVLNTACSIFPSGSEAHHTPIFKLPTMSPQEGMLLNVRESDPSKVSMLTRMLQSR